MAGPDGGSEETAWITAVGDLDAFVAAPGQTIRPDDRRGDTPHQAMDLLSASHADPSAWAVLATLGQGGMGIVHLAEQERLGRKVAIKRLRSDMRGRGAVMALLREAWVTGALEHPNVVPVHDVGLDADGRPYLVMKRVEGETWGALLDQPEVVREQYGAGDVLAWHLEILGSVCNAVHFAHSRGVLHRDLKPENVMVGAFGEVYVLDWGIAVAIDDDLDGRVPLARDVRRLAGTPAYMAPEMVSCGSLSPATDVYLLGAMLYELLAGAPPHRGVRVRADRPERTRRAAPPKGPGELVALAMEALSEDPADRPPSAEAFRLRLRGYLEHRGSDSLAEQAGARLEQLLTMLQTAHDQRVKFEPGEVYPLFGECRFGFQEALKAWPGNRAAQHGLSAGFRAMVRYELQRGDAQAAERLFLAWPDAEPELRASVAQAAAESDVLEDMRRSLDPRVGLRTRWFIIVALGFIWAVSPVVVHYRLGGPTPTMAFDAAVVFGLLMLAAFIWARESLFKTRFNRATVGTLALAPVGQAFMAVGATDLGFDAAQQMSLLIFYWAVIAGMAAVTFEAMFWPSVVGYFAAWLGAAADPANVLLYAGAANGVMTVNAAIAWWPGWDYQPR